MESLFDRKLLLSRNRCLTDRHIQDRPYGGSSSPSAYESALVPSPLYSDVRNGYSRVKTVRDGYMHQADDGQDSSMPPDEFTLGSRKEKIIVGGTEWRIAALELELLTTKYVFLLRLHCSSDNIALLEKCTSSSSNV